MEELKFKRAYFKDKEKTKFTHFESWGVGIDGSQFKSPSSNNFAQYFIDFQFVGLKDKNGNEIYDGDIVEMPNWAYPVEVIYHRPKCRFCCRLIDGINDYIPHNSFVIGNIFETPKLLKRGQEKFQLVKKWNILLPETVINQSWEEPNVNF